MITEGSGEVKKTCKNCRHFSYTKWTGPECHANPIERWSPVWGLTKESRSAGYARKHIGYCGPNGAWFEPKRTLRQKLTAWIKDEG